MQLLHQAHQENFYNLDLLSEAAEALIIAIQNNRTLPEPYLAMAYIFVLLENHQAATSYLKEVLRQYPENADALKLLAEIEAKEKAARKNLVAQGPARPAPTLPKPLPESPEEIDYDDLYESLETLIIEEVRKISEYPNIPPTPKNKDLQEIKKYQQQVQSVLEKIQLQLQVLEAEIETHELLSKLKPLEILQKRYDISLHISQELQELLVKITEEQQLVQEQLGSLVEVESAEDLTIMEENLDSLLDGSDQIANQIETFEQKGYACLEAEKSYSSLVKDIEKLQDAMDDLSELKGAFSHANQQ